MGKARFRPGCRVVRTSKLRDFGFWVRVVAITQLFSVVLINYGDGWLASDNPILTVHKRQAQADAPPAPPPSPPRPATSEADFSKAAFATKKRGDNNPDDGWGGEDDAASAADDSPGDGEEPWLAAEEPDSQREDDDWGAAP